MRWGEMASGIERLMADGAEERYPSEIAAAGGRCLGDVAPWELFACGARQVR